MPIRWTTVGRTVIVATGLIAGAELFVNFDESQNGRLSQSADLVLRIEQSLSDADSLRLMAAIEEGKPILKQNGGRFETWQLDSYIGKYETVYNLYANGLLENDMVYSAFSYNIVKAFQHPEIGAYVNVAQEKDQTIFAGFEYMAQAFEE